MLDNYDVNEDGIIFQVNRSPFNYDLEYASNYSQGRYGEVGNYMSYLRLGNIIGAIQKIPSSILDIGYGNGAFIKVCADTIEDVNGNDITDYPLPDKVKFVSDIFSRHFEVITFFDSLEHFDTIDWVKDLNCDYINISLPNCHYKSDEWFDEWKHRKPNEHLWHFNSESLVRFMNRMGYKCISLSNVEDVIRKNKPDEDNILTGVFKKS